MLRLEESRPLDCIDGKFWTVAVVLVVVEVIEVEEGLFGSEVGWADSIPSEARNDGFVSIDVMGRLVDFSTETTLASDDVPFEVSEVGKVSS